MKPILYIVLAGSLTLGACSSTYKAAQTPDDVYYSPRQQQRTYASGNGSNGNSRQDENASYTESTNDGGGTYVTYQDDDQGDYQRRLNRFGGNSDYAGGYWDGYNSASNLYSASYFGMNSFSPYGGFGYSSLWGPSLSIGLGWGGYGGFYNPFSYGYYGGGWGGWGYPYYSHYPYYGGYYGGGYYGHGGYYGGGYYPRPSNSYGPVRGGNERVVNRSIYTNSGGNGGGGYSRPSRGGNVQPIPGGTNTGGFVNPSSNERPRRVFQESSSERPVSRPSYNNDQNGGYSRPQRVEYSRPASPAPSYTPSTAGGSGRVNTGGGGGGGGYSRPSRGGR
jgi:hypothetical protein